MVVKAMLVYNDNFFTFETYLNMPECTEAKRSSTTIKCGIFQKENIKIEKNFS